MKQMILAVLLAFSVRPVSAAPKDERPEAQWSEVEKIFRDFPAPLYNHQGIYRIPEKTENEVYSKLANLDKTEDVVGTMAERLNSLSKGTDDDEAQIVQLVSMLKHFPDERAAEALERVDRLPPGILGIAPDEDGPRKVQIYPYAAWAGAWLVRTSLAMPNIEHKLVGLKKKERVEALADIFFLSKDTPTDIEHSAAGQMLVKECGGNNTADYLEVLLARVNKMAATTHRDKAMILAALTDLKIIYMRGNHDPRIRSVTQTMLDSHPSDGGILSEARNTLEAIDHTDSGTQKK